MKYIFLSSGHVAYYASKGNKTAIGIADNFNLAWEKCTKVYM